MPFQSVERPPATRVTVDPVDRAARGTPGGLLAARDRERGIAIVEELTRITTAMAGGEPTTSAEILAVAERIAVLRTAVAFRGVVDGF